MYVKYTISITNFSVGKEFIVSHDHFLNIAKIPKVEPHANINLNTI